MRRRRVNWIFALASVCLAASFGAFTSSRAQTTLEFSVPSLNVPCLSNLTTAKPPRTCEGWIFAPSRPSFFSGIVPRVVPSSESPQELGVDDEFPLVAPQEANPESELSPTFSLWAKFPVGSWARWRSTCVAQEKDRSTQSVTETRVVLKSVDQEAKRYELSYERTVKLGGVDYARSSETVVYNFLDVPCDESTVVERLESTNLVIAGKAIPCRTLRASRSNSERLEKTTVWYSPVAAPFVLQKETIRKSTNDETSNSIRELFVVQKTPARALLGLAPTSYATRSSSISEQRKSSTSSVYSPATPGGLIRETTVELGADDDGGSMRTTTVLLDYYVAP